ncbi:MAG TPA: hypothetical protein VNI01_07265 [Elusimicrobiota bacterium]|nr:hypothetical protein [Elusimicrobiota bacterium]
MAILLLALVSLVALAACRRRETFGGAAPAASGATPGAPESGSIAQFIETGPEQ